MKLELTSLDRTSLAALTARLRDAPGQKALVGFAKAQLDSGAWLDSVSGAQLFGPSPSVAPFAFRLVLFPALTPEQIESYEQSHETRLPDCFRSVLLRFNGVRAGTFALNGLGDRNLQPQPAFDAAFVPWDPLVEMAVHRRESRPYAGLFPVGSCHLPSVVS